VRLAPVANCGYSPQGNAIAEWIAAAGPVFGLAVADLLDANADALEEQLASGDITDSEVRRMYAEELAVAETFGGKDVDL
jgi:hypothetical protein